MRRAHHLLGRFTGRVGDDEDHARFVAHGPSLPVKPDRGAPPPEQPRGQRPRPPRRRRPAHHIELDPGERRQVQPELPARGVARDDDAAVGLPAANLRVNADLKMSVAAIDAQLEAGSDSHLKASGDVPLNRRVNSRQAVSREGDFFRLRSAGWRDHGKREKRRLELRAEVANLTDRLNVVNFAGLFSGTAVAPPRSANVRLRFDF